MSITLDSNRHLSFLKQGLKCPYTQETFKHGDRIVFCGNCKCASSADAWDAYNKCAGCGSSNLGPDTIPEIKEFGKFFKPKTFNVKSEDTNTIGDTYTPRRTTSNSNNGWVWAVAIFALIIGINMCSNGSKKAPPAPAPPPITSYTPYTPSNNPDNTATYQAASGIKISMRDLCNDKHEIQYKFFNRTRNLVWPSNSEVWISSGYDKPQTHLLACERGDVICFGAAIYPDTGQLFWGVNIDNSQKVGDSNTCFTCGDIKETFVSPSCPSISVYNPIKPDNSNYLNEANLQYCYIMGKVGLELSKICKTNEDISNIYNPFYKDYNDICGDIKAKFDDTLANAILVVEGAKYNYKKSARDYYNKSKGR